MHKKLRDLWKRLNHLRSRKGIHSRNPSKSEMFMSQLGRKKSLIPMFRYWICIRKLKKRFIPIKILLVIVLIQARRKRKKLSIIQSLHHFLIMEKRSKKFNWKNYSEREQLQKSDDVSLEVTVMQSKYSKNTN